MEKGKGNNRERIREYHDCLGMAMTVKYGKKGSGKDEVLTHMVFVLIKLIYFN